ncbi:MAG: SH3 domain-containing protein [Anaerolineae bacterium]|nr:SH3 domain-containing protein [Anaerolineae bacterium]
MSKKLSIRSLNRPTFFASIAVIGLLFALSSFAYAQVQTEQPTAMVNTGALNVREGPGACYLPIGTVWHFDRVTLLARDQYAAWVQIQTADGLVGWITTLHIVTSYKLSDLPVATSSAIPYATITTGRLNIRTGPGINYPIVFTITQGDKVSLLGRSSNLKWVRVRALDTYVGWINTGYIASAMPISTFPIEGDTAETSPPGGVIPYYGTGIAIPITMPVTEGLDRASAVVTTMPSGSRFMLAGRNESMTRLKIATYDGIVGWVSAIDIGSSIPYMYLPVLDS